MDKSIIVLREMESKERKDILTEAAEVDVDLAEKYGLVEENKVNGCIKGEKARQCSPNDVRGQKEDEESEEDAF